MSTKGSDLVAVHPKHRTVHELKGRHKLACGNPGQNPIAYREMRRKDAGSKECQSAACELARR